MPTIMTKTPQLRSTPWGVFEGFNTFDTRWERSPRTNGVLLLRSNPMIRNRMQHDVRVFSRKGFDHTARQPLGPSGTFGSQQLKAFRVGIDSVALAKFRGKIYKGSASLGITAASWRQSADMIRLRCRMLSGRADYWAERLSHSRDDARMVRKYERQLASFHLEVIFGWVPLMADIQASCNTLITSRFSSWEQVASHHEGFDQRRWSLYEGNNVTASYDTTLTYRCKVSAQVQIDNPNLWLRERAGLNNYASIAWDLVPWSFVVNMFVNTGQLAQSLTDYAGLVFKNQAVTTLLRSAYLIQRHDGLILASSDSGVTSHKERSVGAIPRAGLTFRIPKVEMQTVVMAAALFTQKFRLLSSLVPVSKTISSYPKKWL